MAGVPDFKQCMNPILGALRTLGGSASNQELYDQVVRDMRLTNEQLAIMHPDREDQTEVAYRMAWARTYLKAAGLINNGTRGIWTLTAVGRATQTIDPDETAEAVRNKMRGGGGNGRKRRRDNRDEDQDVGGEREGWKADLLGALLDMPPETFEHLCQRVLRESGFVEVNVEGRSGDGGIDGRGVFRLQNILSFRVVFQCKRWRGSVGAPQIRDFRGAMDGRTDKGLFMTTGTFTPDAQKEASRPGALAIDLIDGSTLVNLMKDLQLGVKTQTIEQVTIDRDWFSSI